MARQPLEQVTENVSAEFFAQTLRERLLSFDGQNKADIQQFQDALVKIITANPADQKAVRLGKDTETALGFESKAKTKEPWVLQSDALADIRREALSVYMQSKLLFDDPDKPLWPDVFEKVKAGYNRQQESWFFWGLMVPVRAVAAIVAPAEDDNTFIKKHFLSDRSSITLDILNDIPPEQAGSRLLYNAAEQHARFNEPSLLAQKTTLEALQALFKSELEDNDRYEAAYQIGLSAKFWPPKSPDPQPFNDNDKKLLDAFIQPAAYRVVKESLLALPLNDEKRKTLDTLSKMSMAQQPDDGLKGARDLTGSLLSENIEDASQHVSLNDFARLQKDIKNHLKKHPKAGEEATPKTPEEKADDFLKRSRDILKKEEAATLQKEIADFINAASNEDLKVENHIYSKAVAAYVVAGALISENTEPSKKDRRERVLILLKEHPESGLDVVKKCSCETTCLIDEQKFRDVPSVQIATDTKAAFTFDLLFMHVATETSVAELQAWLEGAAKPVDTAKSDALKNKLEQHISTFLGLSKLADDVACHTIFMSLLGDAKSQDLFTKAAVFKLLEVNISNPSQTVAALEAIKAVLDNNALTEIGDQNAITLRGESDFITKEQVALVWKDNELKEKLKKTVSERIIALNKSPAPAAPELATTVKFEHIFSNFTNVVKTAIPGATLDASGNIATVTDSATKTTTTIERIPPAADGTGGGVKVTGSQDAVVANLVKLYIEELKASNKITRDPAGKISANSGFTFQLSARVINLNRKDGSVVTSEERNAFLETLDKALTTQLPNIYVVGSLTKGSSSAASKDEDAAIGSRLIPSVFKQAARQVPGKGGGLPPKSSLKPGAN